MTSIICFFWHTAFNSRLLDLFVLLKSAHTYVELTPIVIFSSYTAYVMYYIYLVLARVGLRLAVGRVS